MKHGLAGVQRSLVHPMVVDGRGWVVAESLGLGQPLPMLLLALCLWSVVLTWAAQIIVNSKEMACPPHAVNRSTWFREILPPLVAIGVGGLLLQVLGFAAVSLIGVGVAVLYHMDAQRRRVTHAARAFHRVLVLPVQGAAHDALPVMSAPPLYLHVNLVSLHAAMACRSWMMQRHWAVGLGWSGPTRTYWLFPSADQILRHFSLSAGVLQYSGHRSLMRAQTVDYNGFKPLLVSMGWNGDAQ